MTSGLRAVFGACGLAGLLAVGTPAMAQQSALGPGFYAGALFGGVFTENFDFTDPSGRVEFKFDTGFAVGGFGGYRFGNGVRAEMELSYRQADVEGISIAGSPSVGEPTLSVITGMGNLLYDFGNGPIVPYLGFGVGMVSIDLDRDNNQRFGDVSDVEFGVQFIAGAAYRLADQFRIQADYRYLVSTDPNVTTSSGAGTTTSFGMHNIVMSGRYDF